MVSRTGSFDGWFGQHSSVKINNANVACTRWWKWDVGSTRQQPCEATPLAQMARANRLLGRRLEVSEHISLCK